VSGTNPISNCRFVISFQSKSKDESFGGNTAPPFQGLLFSSEAGGLCLSETSVNFHSTKRRNVCRYRRENI
jgi:hypothetical protein